jgi:hypothetical protein
MAEKAIAAKRELISRENDLRSATVVCSESPVLIIRHASAGEVTVS